MQFRVVRTPDKRFYQESPDGEGGFRSGLKGARRVLYRLPEVIAADPRASIYVVEGEKDVDNVRRHLGHVATCNPGGAGKWGYVAELARTVLANRHVVVIPDADEVGRKHAQDVANSLVDVAASVRIVPVPAKDASDWIAAGGTAAQLAELVAATLPEGEDFGGGSSTTVEQPGTDQPNAGEEWKKELAKAHHDICQALGSDAAVGTRRPLFELDAVDLLQEAFPSPQWQVSGLVTRVGTNVVAGEAKAATKTWLLVEAAVSIATGTKMCGEFVAEQGTVAIFFAEDHKRPVRNRLRATLAGAGRTLAKGRIRLQPRGEYIDIRKDEDLAWVLASARRLGKLDALFLDPFRDIHTAAEDKSDEMAPVMRRLRLLGELLGCTIWFSHHVPKATRDTSRRRPGQNMRGSSAIHGSIDSGLYIEPGDGDGTNVFRVRVTSQVKAARSAGTSDFKLELEDDSGGEAVRATWTVDRDAKAEAKEATRSKAQEEDDRAVFAFVRELAMRGVALSRTGIRGHDERPISERRVTAALDRMLETERLVLRKGLVYLPEPTSDRGHS